MQVLQMDQKGRIHIPKKIKKLLKLKPKQTFIVSIDNETISLSKPQKSSIDKDPVLIDMTERPLRFKGSLNKKLLESLEEELWSS